MDGGVSPPGASVALRSPSRSQATAHVASADTQLSKKYHPDAATGSAEEFHKINEAYTVLGNVSKRSAYDAELNPSRAGTKSGGYGGHARWHPHSPEGRRAAGPHRAWKAGRGTWGKAAPGPQWTGRRKVDPNLGE